MHDMKMQDLKMLDTKIDGINNCLLALKLSGASSSSQRCNFDVARCVGFVRWA